MLYGGLTGYLLESSRDMCSAIAEIGSSPDITAICQPAPPEAFFRGALRRVLRRFFGFARIFQSPSTGFF